jgi:hypothetical protein
VGCRYAGHEATHHDAGLWPFSNFLRILPMKRALLNGVLFVALAASAATLVAASVTAHVVWQREQLTQIFWNGDEAYIFIAVATDGFAGNYLHLSIQALGSIFGMSTDIDARDRTLLVVRCTPETLETRRIDQANVSRQEIFDGAIHRIHGAGLARWNGKVFERVSERDSERYRREKSPYPIFDEFEGWSGRSGVLSLAAGTYEYPIRLKTGQINIVVQKGPFPDVVKTIDVRRVGQPDVRILELKRTPTWVSSEQYEALLGK